MTQGKNPLTRSLTHSPHLSPSHKAKQSDHDHLSAIDSSNYQLIPYSEQRVILYNRSSGQVVLYDKKSEGIEVKPVVSKGLELTHDSHTYKYNNLAVSSRPRSGSVDLRSSASSCPMCLRPMAAHTKGNWIHSRSHTEESQVSPEVIADSQYFHLLARSLKFENMRYALADANKDEDPDTMQSESEYSISSAQLDPLSVDYLDDNGKTDRKTTAAIRTLSGPSSSSVYKDESSKTDKASDLGVASDSFNQGYYDRFFIEEKKLGKGLRGSVFSCQHVLDNIYLGKYAVKKVAVGNNHKWLRRMLREVKLLESLRHPNVVEYKHSWLEMHQLTNFGPQVPCLFILMEYADGGNLQEYIEPKPNCTDNSGSGSSLKQRILKLRRQNSLGGTRSLPIGVHTFEDSENLEDRKRMLTVEEIWSFFADICNGLSHLHQLQIIHRDLKHLNLLLHWGDKPDIQTRPKLPRIMLTDFGECEVIPHIEKRNRTGATGTLEFMAPELIKMDVSGHYLDSYSTKSDMWSLGMVLYYLCYSSLPYSNIDDIDILRKDVLNLKKVDLTKAYNRNDAEDIPTELSDMIKELLNPNEDERPDITDILQQVNDSRNIWHSSHIDAGRFEINDHSEITSSISNTPGYTATPRRRSIASIPVDNISTLDGRNSLQNRDVLVPELTTTFKSPAAQSDSGLQLVKAHDGSVFVVPSGTGTPQEHLLKNDSNKSITDNSQEILKALHKLNTSNRLKTGTDNKTVRTRDSNNASLKNAGNMTLGNNSTALNKKRINSGTVYEPNPKRTRIARNADLNVAFYIKTAVLLLKVHILQLVIESRQAEARAVGHAVMMLTLAISALDIRSDSILLTSILLVLNVVVVLFAFYLGFVLEYFGD